jgi:leader peptidase (prepilin peptidase)/N-methyltransferase
MPLAWWGLAGLFAAALIDWAVDRFSPAQTTRGLTHFPIRRRTIWLGLPALFMLLAWRPSAGELWPACLFAAILVCLAVIDWEQRRAPNAIVLPAVVLAMADAWRGGHLMSAVTGAVLAFALFLGLYLIGRRLYGPGALGPGDVKLAGLIGAMAGVELMPYALALGILLAGAAAATLLLTGRARRGDSLAYGYFMALAAVASLASGLWILPPS